MLNLLMCVLMNLSTLVHFDCGILVLVSVAFLTLLERKMLAYSQYRKGPNKVSVGGFLQPISDAMKLACKEISVPFKANKTTFMLSPMGAFTVALLLWVTWEFSEKLVSLFISSVFILLLISAGIYPMMFMGWSANSKFSLIGAIRSIAQTISYEISLALIMLSMLIMASSLSVSSLSDANSDFPLLGLTPVLSIMWFISCLAETNRTPFDFSEGESELVSGFNTEYSASLFTLIFLGEYLMILYFSLVSWYMVIWVFWNSILLTMGMVFISMLWVWVRATFPRYRYDKLMNLAWKSLLPLSLIYVIWSTSLHMMNLGWAF